eukprot:486740_1
MLKYYKRLSNTKQRRGKYNRINPRNFLMITRIQGYKFYRDKAMNAIKDTYLFTKTMDMAGCSRAINAVVTSHNRCHGIVTRVITIYVVTVIASTMERKRKMMVQIVLKNMVTEFEPESDGVRCDICGQKKRKGDMMHGCRECDYDVCAGCKEGVVRLARCDKGHILQKIERYKAKREARQIQSNQFTELSHDHANTRIQILPRQGNECDKGHVLVYKNNGYGGLFTCNQCGGHISQSMSWHCDTCDYDLCRDCYSFHKGTKE